MIICQDESDPGPDTVIERLSDINLPPPPSQDTIPIEMVELNLVSCQPIFVQNNDDSQQQWNVQVGLSQNMPPPGQMTINMAHENGGTFDSQFPVRPRFIFTPVDGGTITNPGESDKGSIIFSNGEESALIFDPELFDFSALEVPWFVCPDTESDFCPDNILFLADGSWMNLVPLPPAAEDDCPPPAPGKIRDAADKIESSKSPRAQELANRLRLIAETIENILEEVDKPLPTDCPDLP